MKASEQEVLAARRILGEPGGADVERFSAEMEETAQALHAWRNLHSAPPEQTPRRKAGRRLFWTAAAAAACLFGGIVSMVFRSSAEPRIDPGELAWMKPKEVKLGGLGDPLSPPGSPYIGGSGGGGGQTDHGPSFPNRLPPDLILKDTDRFPGDRVRLTYVGPHEFSVAVFLCPSNGPDTRLQEIRSGPRTLYARRRADLLVAIEGETVDLATREIWARLFLNDGRR